ncbi:MAG: DUF6671 family protein [Hyphomonas sp.]
MGKLRRPHRPRGMTLPDRIALGTMHGKAAASAPPLARLGIALTVPEGLDTDRFGTFTGEVPRAGTMVEAARAKALAAIAATGLPVGLASEGAYGAHPLIPFLPQGRELLLWHDSRSGHEIIETLTDDAPAFDHIEVAATEDAQAFLTRIGFPQTAVIVTRVDGVPVAKGVQDMASLARALRAAGTDGAARLQSDMRAHHNPRRMSMIGQLAERLAQRLARRCPDCGAPGWGLLRLAPGLPCASCGGPSLTPEGEIHGCTACGATTLHPRFDGVTEADPGMCPLCNP